MCHIAYIREDGTNRLIKDTFYCSRAIGSTVCDRVVEESPSDSASLNSFSTRNSSDSSFPRTPPSADWKPRPPRLELRTPSTASYPQTPSTSPPFEPRYEYRTPRSHERADYHEQRRHKEGRRYIVPEFVFTSHKSERRESRRRSRSTNEQRRHELPTPDDSAYRSSSDNRRYSYRYVSSPTTHQPQTPPPAPEAPQSSHASSSLKYRYYSGGEREDPPPPSPISPRRTRRRDPVVLHQDTFRTERVEEPLGDRIYTEPRTRRTSRASTMPAPPVWPFGRDREDREVKEVAPKAGGLSKKEKAKRQAEYDEAERIRWLNKVNEREAIHREKEERRRREEDEGYNG